MKIITGLLLAAFCFSAKAAEWLNYESHVVLEDTLSEQAFAGPPKYEIIFNGDKKETYFFIRPAAEFCVTKGKDNFEIPIAKASIVQLMFPYQTDTYGPLRPYLGQQFLCQGELWPRETAHHPTQVLLADAVCRSHR